MRYLEGGCSVPLGVHSEYNQHTQILTVKGIIVSPDGTQAIEAEVCGKINDRDADCERLGIELGDKLKDQGAQDILDSIDMTRINAKPTEV